MMTALRYSEVHQVNIEQLKLLMELLNELANCGGIASQDISETKVLNSFNCNINEQSSFKISFKDVNRCQIKLKKFSYVSGH